MILKKNPLIIGICGGSGSGKSTLVKAVINKFNNKKIINIHHDWYYKDRNHISPSDRENINYDHPNSLETELLIIHLKELIKGKQIEAPLYDFSSHTRKKSRKLIKPVEIIIVEGILIFTEFELRKLINLKIFVDTDDDIRFIRRLQRDMKERGRTVDSVIKQYLQSVKLMYEEFVKPCKKYADIIISGGKNCIAKNMIIGYISQYLKSSKKAVKSK